MGVDCVLTKLGMAAGLLATGAISATAPKYLFKMNKNIFSCGNMFASGVLLGACLCHQLPDASANLQGDFPWSFFICGCTFTAFLLIEEAMHLLLTADHQHDHGVRVQAFHIERASSAPAPDVTFLQDALADLNPTVGCDADDKCHPLLGASDDDKRLTNHEYQPPKHDSELGLPTQLGHDTRRCHHTPDGRDERCHSDSCVSSATSSQEHHHHDNHIMQHLHGSMVASLSLLVSLTLHSFLAGFGLGSGTCEDLVATSVAIIAHKLFAGYALGSSLTASVKLSKAMFFTYVGTFACSTPVGLVLAASMEDFALNPSCVAGIEAAVSGTFLYISIFEVGMKELLVCRVQAGVSVCGVGKRMEIAKLCSMIGGYGGMAALALWL